MQYTNLYQSVYPAFFAVPMSESTTTVPSESALHDQSINTLNHFSQRYRSLTRPTGLLVCRYHPTRNSQHPPPFRRGYRKQDRHDVCPIIVHNLQPQNQTCFLGTVVPTICSTAHKGLLAMSGTFHPFKPCNTPQSLPGGPLNRLSVDHP